MDIVIEDLSQKAIAAVIPCYRVEREIGPLIASLPGYIKYVIVVDDASPDETSKIVLKAAERDRRIVLIRHESNLGVGGAMITGFRKALELNAQLIVKIDGDGQMDPAQLPNLLSPIIQGRADYTKGNRFRDFQALQKMPIVRRIGNMALGFLTKAATGYWNLFDPTNGFVAIHGKVLAQLQLERIEHGYFFEISMLANLYLLGAVIKDVPMPARYGSEVSSLSVRRSLIEFPAKLLRTFLRRLILKNLIYDFSMASIYMLASLPLLLFGFIFGISKWAQYSALKLPAPTGTVMLPTLSVILGIQFLIAAIEIDLRSTPKEPISPQL
ncbi:MAG: glycosyltransferase family 2 protein [Chloroflexota bacterium]